MRQMIAIVIVALTAAGARAEWDTVVDRMLLSNIGDDTFHLYFMRQHLHDIAADVNVAKNYMGNVQTNTILSRYELEDINQQMATVVSLLTSIEAGGITANMSGVESRLDAANNHLVNLQALVGAVQTNTGETAAELVQANEWLEDVHAELVGLRSDVAPLAGTVVGNAIRVDQMDALIEAVELIQGGADMSEVVELLQSIDNRLHVELTAGDWDLIEAVMGLGSSLELLLNNMLYEIQANGWKLDTITSILGVIQTNTGETVAELVEVNQHLAGIEGFTEQTAGYLELIDAELQLQGLALDDLLTEQVAQGLDISAIRTLLEDWLDDEEPGSVGGGETPGFEMPEDLEGDELYPDDWTDYPTEAEAQRDLMQFQLGQFRQGENTYIAENLQVDGDRPTSDGNHVFAFDFSELFASLGVSGLPSSWQWELKSDWYDANLRTWVFTAGILFASWSVAWMIWAETRKG